MAKRVKYQGHGQELEGEIGEPAGGAKAPAVVLVQEWWGVNDHVRSLVDRLTKEGFLVLAPDLYHGKIAKSAAEAGEMMNALDKQAAVKEIGAAIEHLASHARGNGKVGIIGFCMGGALTLASAATYAKLKAAVPFYGLPGVALPWGEVRVPIQAHFSRSDQWATVAGAEEIKAAVTKGGGSMEIFSYDAEHAFMNDTRPEVYDGSCAKDAWERAVAFLHKHVG